MSDAKRFALELDREWLAKQDDIADAVALIGLSVFSGIVNKTPVDTGRLRGNWNVSIGGVNDATTEVGPFDTTGQSKINTAAAILGGYGRGNDGFPVINISNGLPYAEVMERGRHVEINSRTGFPQWYGSFQAPAGMVALTIAETEARFDGYEV